jgi:hypothetical protein
MKRFTIATLLLLIAFDVNAADYKNIFGFKFQLPKSWIVLSKDEVRKRGASWSSDVKIPSLTPEQNRAIVDKMQSGAVEFYYNEATANDNFTDNVVVDKKSGRVPNDRELNQYCDQTRQVLSKMFAKEITIHECRLVSVANKATLYIISDGVVQDTRNVFYNIQRTPDSIIGLTLTSKLSSLSSNKTDFESLIRSIRF